MNGTTRNAIEETFFLSQLVGARAYVGTRKIGKVGDVVAVDQGKVAEVTHFQITRPFGDPALLVPLAQVRSSAFVNWSSTSRSPTALCGRSRPMRSS